MAANQNLNNIEQLNYFVVVDVSNEHVPCIDTITSETQGGGADENSHTNVSFDKQMSAVAIVISI